MRMNKSEKNFDAGLRILEVLKVLLNENLKKVEVIEKLKSNDAIESVYSQEAFVKYFNTLEALGFELERAKNKYILLNAIYSIDITKKEKELLQQIILKNRSLYRNKNTKDFKTAISKINKYLEPRYSIEELSLMFDKEEMQGNDNLRDKLLLSIGNMIIDNQQVVLKYWRTKNKIEELKVELKDIVEKNKNIFVRCYCPSVARNKNINIDSIVELNQLPNKSQNKSCLNSVVFELYGRLMSSYKLKPSEKVINFSPNHIAVSNSEEDKDILLRRLLKYGENCRIVKPKSLKDEMIELTNEMLKNLEGN